MGIDPLEQEETATVRLSLDLPADTVAFLERFALYRNALNTLTKRSVKKWTRKSAAEAFVATQVQTVLTSMAEAIAEHGALPDDEKDMAAYARRVLQSTEKSNDKNKKR